MDAKTLPTPQNPQYPLADSLQRNGCRHCVSIFVKEWKLPVTPVADDSSATLTIVEFRERLYGITCQHVMGIVDKNRNETGMDWDLWTVVGGTYVVQRRLFRQPVANLPGPAPDIAIRELHPGLVEKMGKQPLKLREPPAGIGHALAYGYPTAQKRDRSEQKGARVEIPCIYVCAELHGRVHEQFQLFSELDKAPEIHDFSGMSGGPIYWSTDDDYGLLGIMYEAARPMPSQCGLGTVPLLHVCGELVTPARFEQWIHGLRPLY